MKISLKNIRSHKEFSVELPSTGLVRIKGPSGVGKSNIFKAIDWGLYGKVQNIARYGSSSSSVEVSEGVLPNLMRTKGPNLLKVDGGFTNETAQKIVESALKMNHAEFMVSSYVMQDQKNSLLSIPPADQLELIQSLSTRSGDPEATKARLEEECDKITEKIDNITSSISALKSAISTNEESMFLIKKQMERKETHDVDELNRQVSDYDAKIRDLDSSLTALRSILVSKRAERDDKERKAYFKTLDSIATFHTTIESIRRDIAALEDSIDETALSDKRSELKQLEVRFSELFEAEVFYLKVMKAKKEADSASMAMNELRGRFPAIPSDFFEAPVGELKEFKCALEELISTKTVNDKASSVEEVADPREEKSEVSSKAAALRKEISKMEGNMAVLEKDKTSLEKAQKQLDLAINSVSSMTGVYLTDEEINSSIDDITAKGQSISALKQEAETAKSKVQEKIQETEFLASQKELLKRHEEISEEKRDFLAVAEKVHETLRVRLARVLRIKELAKKASLDSIEAIVEEINLFADYWVRTMFGGTVKAYLKTSKELKTKKTTVGQISLYIEENGTVIDKKEELSGGQQSRLCLAFQLALSDMYDSPILMLDEAFKGLDENTMATCLAAVKQISERKLVLVSEHFANDEIFDQTVEL
jgi:DNA repair exonuclease SbcCD ATPase subunit